jgi:GGDEF domain-containing protein
MTFGSLLKPQVAEQHLRILGLLIQAIGLHAMDSDTEDHENFRSQLAGLEARITTATPMPEVLEVIGEVVESLELYNRQAAGRLRAQAVELRGIIGDLAEGMVRLLPAANPAAARLKTIQAGVPQAEQLDDLRRLREQLSDCMEEIAGADRHGRNSNAGLAELAEAARDFESRVDKVRAPDPITGLPAKPAGEDALGRAAQSGAPALAVALVLKRYNQINLRFGAGIGDELLTSLCAYVKSSLNPEEGLFRWDGPALLAIVRRTAALDRVRREIGRLVAAVPQHEVRIGSRAAMLSIAVGWAVFPVANPVERTFRQVDTFLSEQNSEDPFVAS